MGSKRNTASIPSDIIRTRKEEDDLLISMAIPRSVVMTTEFKVEIVGNRLEGPLLVFYQLTAIYT